MDMIKSSLDNFLSLLIDNLVFKTAWKDLHVKIYVSATWAISGTSGTNMKMAITQLDKVQVLGKTEI